MCYFSLLHTFSFEFFKLKHNCIVFVRTREFVQDFFLNQNTFFNTSMASRRMEYIYYNAMMTNAIGFVWIHIDRSFSPSFEGIWTNTQQIPWFLRFCFIFIFDSALFLFLNSNVPTKKAHRTSFCLVAFKNVELYFCWIMKMRLNASGEFDMNANSSNFLYVVIWFWFCILRSNKHRCYYLNCWDFVWWVFDVNFQN